MDPAPWHALSVAGVLRRLETRAEGLTSEEAAGRLARFGRNAVAQRRPVSAARLLLRQFSNFFIWALLLAAGLAFAISYLPGEAERRLTGFFILGIVLLSILLSFFQEYRAQRELEALSRLLVSRAEVRRDGRAMLIDAAEVVPGDVLVLSHGRKVAADARVIEANDLRTDESALTGESMDVEKSPAPAAVESPLAERTSLVFASTYVTRGAGLAVAVRTGSSTEVGGIAATLQQMKERPTPFQAEVQKMARHMTVLIAVSAVFVAVLLLLVLHQSLIDVALNTLSLAVATIPESLPIVLTFALALGARRMAMRKVVVRRLSIVESLGSVDTICTDKTGTLTQNIMTLRRLFADGRDADLSEDEAAGPVALELLRVGALCNDAALQKDGQVEVLGDPVDSALVRAAMQAGLDVDAERAARPRISEIPFSSERKRMTTLHRHDGGLCSCTKGAPGAVLERSAAWRRDGRAVPLDDRSRAVIHDALERLQRDGWYVIALATKEAAAAADLGDPEQDMIFLGLGALADPPRPGAKEAIAQARLAGMRVVMITGDNALTARTIGRDMGIGQNSIEAGAIESLSPEALVETMKRIDIVARATPETKQRVLAALQGAGHFVAMTGDGVNDATALKQSDVGVAMGLRGTDIAKESASMVLLDDNFATIVAGIEEGRRIFDNIRKFTNYLLSTTLTSLVVVLALSVAGYFPLTPRMLLWVNLVTDLVPASALAADPAVPHLMRRRPRRHDEPILNKALYATIAGSVLRTLIAYAFIFWAGLKFGGVQYAQTMLFTSIVLHAFTRVMVVRQLDNLTLWSNPALLYSIAASVGLQLLALYTPLRDVFGVEPLDWRAWAVMVPVVAASSVAGVYMTRWILRILPLWDEAIPPSVMAAAPVAPSAPKARARPPDGPPSMDSDPPGPPARSRERPG
jgi:Ca2+-transporting ATPase